MELVIGEFNYSSWSMRGWLAVKASGLDFEEINLPLDTPAFHTRIKDLSPSKLVPCLIDGPVKVWDSLAIIDYLDRLAPEAKFWPDDKAAFGLARSVAAEMHTGFSDLKSACPMNLRKTWTNFDPGEAAMQDVETIIERWQACRKTNTADGAFLFGAWSAVDIMFAPVVMRFDGYDLPRTPEASAYMDAVKTHPDVAAWIAIATTETSLVAMDEISGGQVRDGFYNPYKD